MAIELLLAGLFILFVLSLLVAFVYSMVFILGNARSHDTLAKGSPSQQHFLAASLMNFLNQK